MSYPRTVIHKSLPGQPESRRQAMILGAGPTGLTLAYELRRRGVAAIVLESSPEPGGAVRSHRQQGYLAEMGPNTLQLNRIEQLMLLGELGLRERLLQPSPQARNRYICRNARPVAAPTGPGGLWSTSLFSTFAKCRLLSEPFRGRRRKPVEESVASFVRRRLGREVLDYAVNPFVAGIYAGDPEHLSLGEAFPSLKEMEELGGSLLKGGLKAMKAARAKGYRMKPLMVSFPEGLGELTKALAQTLEGALHLETTVQRICRRHDRWEVQWRDAAGEQHTRQADALVLSCPAHAIAALPLPPEVSESLEPLQRIAHPPVTSLTLGYRRSDVAHALDGFGMLVPEVEKRQILGVLFNSSLFPGRAPQGAVTLTVFLGGTRQPEMATCPLEETLPLVQEDLRELLGVKGEPELVLPTHWPQAIPQYELGYQELVKVVPEAEAAYPGLYLQGNYLGGIALGQCLTNAMDKARDIAEQLQADN